MVGISNSFSLINGDSTYSQERHLTAEIGKGALHDYVDCIINSAGKLVRAYVQGNDGNPARLHNEEIALDLSFKHGTPIQLFDNCFQSPNGHYIDKAAQIDLGVIAPAID